MVQHPEEKPGVMIVLLGGQGTGKRVCRTHGGASTGPKTREGRQRCAETKTVHGNETRKVRSDRAEAMGRLRALEELGHALGIMHGPRMPGRKGMS
jgi:hypothetical protein